MIQVSRTSPPAVPEGLGEADALMGASMTNADVAAQIPAGDPLARFGAMHGFHPQAQQFGHASPDGGGSARAETSPRKAAGDPPITATGQAGGQAWLERGNKLLMAHRYKDAIEAYREGFRTYPDSAFI